MQDYIPWFSLVYILLCVGLNPRRLSKIGDMRSPGIRSQSVMSAVYVFSKLTGYRVLGLERAFATCELLGILGLLVSMILTEFGMGSDDI
jgi:hypothetical protein